MSHVCTLWVDTCSMKNSQILISYLLKKQGEIHIQDGSFFFLEGCGELREKCALGSVWALSKSSQLEQKIFLVL